MSNKKYIIEYEVVQQCDRVIEAKSMEEADDKFYDWMKRKEKRDGVSVGLLEIREINLVEDNDD